MNSGDSDSTITVSRPVAKKDELLLKWPYNLESFSPSVVYGGAAASDLERFEKAFLSKSTAVEFFKVRDNHQFENELLEEDFAAHLETPEDGVLHKIYYVHRFILNPERDITKDPRDVKRLRISKLDFRRLISKYDISPNFISSSLGNGIAVLPFHERRLNLREGPVIDVWYALPIRIDVGCPKNAEDHILSEAGSNQMDPSRYLHLNSTERDIRPSKIIVCFRHNLLLRTSTTICLDFQDGRWWKAAEEPLARFRETLKYANRRRRHVQPFFTHSIVLSSVACWWRRALAELNKELIVYGNKLQNQMNDLRSVRPEFSVKTHSALQTIVVHLNRYKTEMDLLESTAKGLAAFARTEGVQTNPIVGQKLAPAGPSKGPSKDNHFSGDSSLDMFPTEFQSLNMSIGELHRKAEAMISLLFNILRASNDVHLLTNNSSMHQVLEATNEETRLSRQMAKGSQRMALDMKKDSTSMKTIAIVTMFFLPGTSYAAILSMPFFADLTWMKAADRCWLWFVLTVPSTVLTFLIFSWYSRKSLRKSREAMAADKEEGESRDLEQGTKERKIQTSEAI